MKVEEQVKNYIAEAIEGTDLFVVDLKFLPRNRIVILLDGDKGVGIDECAKVSRHVSHKMEEDNLIEGAHTLEVSSPGVDHPLKFARQYPQHIGRNLHVLLKDGKEFEGKLLSIEGEKIAVEAKIKEKGKKPFLEEKTFELEEIKEAKIKIVF